MLSLTVLKATKLLALKTSYAGSQFLTKLRSQMKRLSMKIGNLSLLKLQETIRKKMKPSQDQRTKVMKEIMVAIQQRTKSNTKIKTSTRMTRKKCHP